MELCFFIGTIHTYSGHIFEKKKELCLGEKTPLSK